MNRLSAYTVYLIMSGAGSFLGTTIWVVGAVYYVLSVHMNPLQLVLAGTALEISYFLFQVPTGVFADTHSRRLSVIIGTLVIGACWMFQGLVPLFAAVILAELVRGLGEAFLDGAESAWLSDEIGQEHFGRAVLRGTQVSQVTSIVATFAGVALASIRLNLPIVLGGAFVVVLGLFLAVVMPENGFHPTQHDDRNRRETMMRTFRSGSRIVRGSTLLIAILCLGAVFGTFSEGFDRLWEAHFLRDFALPHLGHLKPVVWFGIFNAGAGILNIAVVETLRRRIDMTSHVAVTRVLFAGETLLTVSVITFGLAGNFALAVAAFLTASAARRMNGPVYSAWLNQNIADSSVRATVLSMGGQADALGQFIGGPIIGVIGTVFSLRAALTAAGLVLIPSLPVFGWMMRRSERTPIVTGSEVATEAP